MCDIYVYDELTSPAWEEMGFGISAKTVVSALNACRGEETIMHVRCEGGSMWEGMAIYDAIQAHGNVTYRIESIALSAASFMGLAAKKIEMQRFADMMIHPPASYLDAMVYGFADDMRNLAAQARSLAGELDKSEEKIIEMYASYGKQSKEWFAEKVRAESEPGDFRGTWFTAEEAMEAGLIHSIYGGKEDSQDADNKFSASRSPMMAARMKQAPERIRNRMVERAALNRSGFEVTACSGGSCGCGGHDHDKPDNIVIPQSAIEAGTKVTIEKESAFEEIEAPKTKRDEVMARIAELS